MYAIQQEPEAGRSLRVLIAGVALSVLTHGALLTGSSAWPQRVAEATPARVRMTIVRQLVQAAPQPPAADERQPTQPPTPTAEPKPTRMSEPKPATKSQPKPRPRPARLTEAAPPAKPVPLVVGLTLSSTTPSGKGARFGVGNTLVGTPKRTAAPAKAGPLDRGPSGGRSGPRNSSSSKHRTAASLRRSSPPHYPIQAKHDGLEGVVVLSITISAHGHVEDATVLRGLGSGLDESALNAARDTLWSPATIDGQAVRSTRRFNVRFTIHG